jgi:hypothetical protein
LYYEKRTSPTIPEIAIIAVPEFENGLRKLDQQVALCNQSKSTGKNILNLLRSKLL